MSQPATLRECSDPPVATVRLVDATESSLAADALATMFAGRGVDGLRFVELGANDEQHWCLGAALRMTCDDGHVQDFALFTTREAAPRFVRWMFGFADDRVLDDAALLDGVGETLNQLVGRIKERWIATFGSQPILDVPRVLGPDACALYLAAHPELQRTEVLADAWTSGLQIAVSPLQDPTLCALDEVLGLLACADGDHAVLARARAGLAVVGEQLPMGSPTSARIVLTRCVETISGLINGASRDVASVSDIVRSLRAEVVATCRRDDFVIPDDADMVGLLGELVEEAHAVLAGARGVVEGDGSRDAHALLRAMHTVKGNAGFFGLEQVQRLAHSTESMLAQVRERGRPLDDGYVRATRRSIDLLDDYIAQLGDRLEAGAVVPYDRAIDLHRAAIDAAVERGTSPVVDGVGTAALAEQNVAMVRVAEAHLDTLDRIEQGLAALVGRQGGEAAQAELAALQRRLAATCRSLRRVGLDRLLGKVRRLCTETAEHLGKLVRVDISGDALDVPRHLATALSGPLVHLARNAIDHGIEDPEARRATSKPLLATVACRASWEGGWLVVELSDDGRGVDPERVWAKAMRAGLVAEGASPSSTDVLALLMTPGFSTAETTTDLSGRGVGLDVVRREIEAVGGRVELASTFGSGSTFRILLPEDPHAPAIAEGTAAEQEIVLADDGALTFL